MALLSHATVKFSDDDASAELRQAEPTLLSLQHPTGNGSTQVLFGTALFDTHNEALKEFLQSLAHTSQTVELNVILDSDVLKDHPQQLEKIRSYIHVHKEVLVQRSLQVANASALTNQSSFLSDAAMANSTLLLMGDFALLQACSAQMDKLVQSNVNVVLISCQAQDHAMLSCDTKPLLPKLQGIVNESTLYQRASRETLQQFIAKATLNATIQDSQLFHWIEGNAYQLGQLNEQSIDYVVKRFFALQWPYNSDSQTNQRSEAWHLTYANAHFCNTIIEATDGELTQTDATALYLLLICHSSVEAHILDIGAEARVWHLLNTLGFTLWHEGLQFALNSSEAISQTKALEQLEAIGQRVQTDALNALTVQSLVDWLKEQNDLIN